MSMFIFLCGGNHGADRLSMAGIVVVLIVSFLLANAAHAEGTDGTWRLVMRKLPNGTELKPPAVYGMSTTKTE